MPRVQLGAEPAGGIPLAVQPAAALTGPPASPPPSGLPGGPLRLVALTLAVAMLVVASSGQIATRMFDQPDTLKYLITVGVPAFIALLALSENPLRWLGGAAVVVAPFNFEFSQSGVHVTALVGVLALALAVAIVQVPERLPKHGRAALALFVVALLPALVAGVDQFGYAQWIVQTALMGWITFLVARQPGGLRYVSLALALSATIQGVLAIWEYKSGHRLDLYASSGSAAVSANYFFQFGTATRSSGALPDPIGLGNFLALVGPLMMPLAVLERDKVIRALLVAGGAICLLALIFSFSRMSWIAAILGVGVTTLLLPGRSRIYGIVGLGVVTFVMLSIGLALGGTSLRHRITSVIDPTTSKTTDTRTTARGDQYRKRVWGAGLQVAAEHPVTGVGFGKLGPALERHGVQVPTGSHAHDTYLQYLGQGGVLGLLALLGPMLLAFRDVLWSFARERAVAIGVAGGLVATLAFFSTDVEIRYAQISTMIAAVLALAAAAAASSRRADRAGLRVVLDSPGATQDLAAAGAVPAAAEPAQDTAVTAIVATPAAPEAPETPETATGATAGLGRGERPAPWRLVPAPVRTVRQMRVVLATPAREEGGVLRNVLDLAEGAAARGHHVVVATPGDAAAVRAAVEAHDLPWMELRRSTRLRADVWHLHVPNSLDTALLALLTRRRWVAGSRVLTEHLPRTARTDASLPLDPTLKHGRRKPGAEQGKTAFKRLEFSLVDQIIAPGAAAAEFLAERYGLPRSAVQAIHNGIAAPEAPAPPPPGDVMEVVVVGMLAHRKGHDVLLEACRLAERSWNVTVIGDGPLREALEEEARGIEDRAVRFTGWRDDAAQAPLAAHVACVPSRMESFGYVALEAMACARPVVASDIDGLSEVVEHGRTGLLVPSEDPAAFAAALDELAMDPALRRRMGEAAHTRVREQFSADDMVDRTLAVYAELAARRSG